MVRCGQAGVGLLGALLLLGCGRAAAVLLDIPPRPEPVEGTGSLQVLAGGPVISVRDTLPPPPIERVSDPDSVLAMLPKDWAGNVDWSQALRDGVIRPRRSLPGEPEPPESGFGFDFLFGDMETAFPHSSHVVWGGCGSCHPTLFPRPGTKITMEEISSGEACGRCHGTVAFPPDSCERCHSALVLGEDRKEAEFLGESVLSRGEESLGSDSYPPSVFPHWVHRIRYTCQVCHPQPFSMRAGETTLTMADLEGGRTCGACHDGATAFGVLECGRCHRSVGSEAVG